MVEKIVITGVGIMSPNGVGIDAFRSSLRLGRSGIKKLDHLDCSMLQTKVAGFVDNGAIESLWHEDVGLDTLDRTSVMGLITAGMAASDARLPKSNDAMKRRGLIIGSAFGPVNSCEHSYKQFYQETLPYARPLTIEKILSNACSQEIARRNHINLTAQTITTMGASSLDALAHAKIQLEQGLVDIMLVGGVECPLSQEFLRTWDAYRIMTREHNLKPESASRPFSLDHTGMVLSEGCAFLVLERELDACDRDADVYAEVVSVGQSYGSSDLMTPDTDCMRDAMRKAIRQAEISAESLSVVFAHAPSIPTFDDREAQALQSLLGDSIGQVPVTAVKSLMGHAMGASGLFTVVAALIAMREDFVPPTINLDNPATACDGMDIVTRDAREGRVDTALVNAFSLGGNNVSVVLKSMIS